jgi:hypothetical protein
VQARFPAPINVIVVFCLLRAIQGENNKEIASNAKNCRP